MKKDSVLLSFFPMLFYVVGCTSHHPITLEGPPAIRLTLDRDYRVIIFSSQVTKGPPHYILFPEDDQSGANFIIGKQQQDMTVGEMAQRDEGITLKNHSGIINGNPVVWRRWKSQHHFQTECTVKLKDASDIEWPIYIIVTANSDGRLESLEKAFSKIEFIGDVKR